MPRESRVIATLVELADNLVDNFDIIELLTTLSNRCVETFDVDAAGVMLASPGGELQYVASSHETMRILELFQLQANEGPCVDCFRDGKAIINHALRLDDGRWPLFTPQALNFGFHSVHCLPLRLRGRTVGALNLFRIEEGILSDDDVVLAQGLADVATIALLQHQTALDARMLNDQLSNALNSRIIIEQAKGIVGQATHCDMDEAFDRLRAHSRNHNLRLTDVARSIVTGELLPSALVARGGDVPR